jgi:hypothetical protein
LYMAASGFLLKNSSLLETISFKSLPVFFPTLSLLLSGFFTL